LALGKRESGTARLEEAAVAYRELLKEWTQEKAPLDWAMTQNNLGTALWALGVRESSTARLEEAAAAYREALKEWTREKVPLQWARAQLNLGNTLSTLGERENNVERLEAALRYFRQALAVAQAAGVQPYVKAINASLAHTSQALEKARLARKVNP
jgi:tetratricopeptide (TPR) repeat protein